MTFYPTEAWSFTQGKPELFLLTNPIPHCRLKIISHHPCILGRKWTAVLLDCYFTNSLQRNRIKMKCECILQQDNNRNQKNYLKIHFATTLLACITNMNKAVNYVWQRYNMCQDEKTAQPVRTCRIAECHIPLGHFSCMRDAPPTLLTLPDAWTHYCLIITSFVNLYAMICI